MTEIEKRIQVKIDLEGRARGLEEREQIAESLSRRFDFDVDKIYNELSTTKYRNVFSTGTVYWMFDTSGSLVWFTRLESKTFYSLEPGSKGLSKLYKRLRRRW